MLNLKVPEQLTVAESINELFKKGFDSTDQFTPKEHIDLENQLLKDMRDLVEKHWDKIKNINV
jgi:hypothetical protein